MYLFLFLISSRRHVFWGVGSFREYILENPYIRGVGSFNLGFWILDNFGFRTNMTPDLFKINKKRNKFSKRLIFSTEVSPIDWLQCALKIRHPAKFFVKLW